MYFRSLECVVLRKLNRIPSNDFLPNLKIKELSMHVETKKFF